jgi:hypothetical protein
VNHRPRQAVFLAIPLSLAASLLLAPIVTATQRSSDPGPVWGCDGGLCATARFKVTYQVVQQHSEGQTYWHVSKIEIWGSLGQGTKQQASVIGVDPVPHSWNVQFLNSSGSVLLTTTPSGGTCYNQVNDATALWWARCNWYGVDVPLSATKVRTNVYVDDFTTNGTGWQKTWTMSLN